MIAIVYYVQQAAVFNCLFVGPCVYLQVFDRLITFIWYFFIQWTFSRYNMSQS